MVRLKPLSPIGVFLSLILLGLTLFAAEAFAQKVKTTVVHASPALKLVAEPATISICEGQSKALVQLNAALPDGKSGRYTWRTSGGRIVGEGPVVNWDLTGLLPGYHKATVEIETGSDKDLCRAFASTIVLVNSCSPPPLTCPRVSISCPETPVAGQPIQFNATVAGAAPNIKTIYNWTVSAGTITSGQGTSSIKVDTTGLAGQSVNAYLTVPGYPDDCAATCIVQVPVPIEPRKFDEFPDVARNDEKARLDNYVIELQNDPSATGHVIVYPGKNGKNGAAQAHADRIVDYMINSRGIDSRRVVTFIGPARPDLMVELWVSPQGAKAPAPH